MFLLDVRGIEVCRYPERCLGLIVRGIFLNTSDEFDAVYARS
jgi:hypothetical protein